MQYFFHPKAQNEFDLSIDYYENIQKGLGLDFANEVYKTIQRVLKFPNAWQKLDGDIRRAITNRYPYGVIYYQKDNQIIILAIMQLQRKPDYWKSRR